MSAKYQSAEGVFTDHFRLTSSPGLSLVHTQALPTFLSARGAANFSARCGDVSSAACGRFHGWVGVTWAHSPTAARGRVEQQVEVRGASRQTGNVREPREVRATWECVVVLTQELKTQVRQKTTDRGRCPWSGVGGCGNEKSFSLQKEQLLLGSVFYL